MRILEDLGRESYHLGRWLTRHHPRSPTTVTTDAEFAQAIGGVLGGDTTTIPQALSLYPDTPALGSPFRTELIGATPENRFFGATNQFKRVASAYGDILFHTGRRTQLRATAKKFGNAWSYSFTQPLQQIILNQPAYGIFHSGSLTSLFNKYNPANDIFFPGSVADATASGYAGYIAAATYANATSLQYTNDVLSGECS